MKTFLKIIWGIVGCVGLWNIMAPKNLCWLEPNVAPILTLVFIALTIVNTLLWVDEVDI